MISSHADDAATVDDAMIEACDRLEEARCRAVEDTQEPVYQGEKKVGVKNKISVAALRELQRRRDEDEDFDADPNLLEDGG